MTIGSFGPVSFEVSSNAIETFETMTWTSGVLYQQHKIHGSNSVHEFTGFDASKVTFEIILSAFLGVNPKTELDKLEEVMNERKAYPLVLGTDVIGAKWLLSNLSRTLERVYKDGSLLSATVQITLIEQR